jgi:hypothetical protein
MRKGSIRNRVDGHQEVIKTRSRKADLWAGRLRVQMLSFVPVPVEVEAPTPALHPAADLAAP